MIEGILYNVLVQLIADLSNTNTENPTNIIRNTAVKLIEIIEAQHIINTYALQSNSLLYYYMPFYLAKNLGLSN